MKRLRQETPPLQLVEQLKAFILNAQSAQAGNADEIATLKQLAKELRKEREFLQVMLLAAFDDRPVPIALFKPWSSYPPIRNAEITGKLTLERRNGKVLVTPSAFFAWFNYLPTQVTY